jgi:hypothetical protein
MGMLEISWPKVEGGGGGGCEKDDRESVDVEGGVHSNLHTPQSTQSGNGYFLAYIPSRWKS